MMERFGDAFAIRRYDRYGDVYSWKEHSVYKKFVIERCYDGPQPKACYRAIDYDRDTIICGEGLAQVKSAITRYIKEVLE